MRILRVPSRAGRPCYFFQTGIAYPAVLVDCSSDTILLLHQFLNRRATEKMIASYRLPLDFDPQALKRDLDSISPDEWVPHFNTDYFDGQWTGVSLRSVDGSVKRLYTAPNESQSFSDSPLLDRCPHVRAALNLIRCPLRSVRFLKLAAGSIIREHRDYDLGFAFGQIRLHIPVTTNSETLFFLDAHRIEMNAGECWYLDLSLPHWVENRGPTDRIHLVIDCELNDWLRNLLPTDRSGDDTPALASATDEQSCPAELDRFRSTVLENLDLQRRLRHTSDRKSFVRLAVAVGHALGYSFAATDVENALRHAQMVWLQRWID